MPQNVSLQVLHALQQKSDRIRNICVLAHVDHGKTTLCDSLIASNGIISQKTAGEVRYMDSRPDEQRRGITMKASSISLWHRRKFEATSNSPVPHKDFLVNLIDSPGHVDFSGEVETGIRISDGCLLVVDVVEGVSAQTKTVIRQLFREKLKPILVLNKIDRLYLELYMTSVDVWNRLREVIENVNAEVAMLETRENVAAEERAEQEQLNSGEVVDGWQIEEFTQEEVNQYFDPAKLNVVFASAIGSWAFTLDTWIDTISSMLFKNELSERARRVFRKSLFLDYYLTTKAKKLQRNATLKGKTPLFVAFILKNLETVIKTVAERRDKEATVSIVKALNAKRSESQQIKLHANEINKIPTDPNVALKAIMSQWMPLSIAILDTVTDTLPSPLDMPIERVRQIISAKYHASVIGAGFNLKFGDNDSDSEDMESEDNDENTVVKNDNEKSDKKLTDTDEDNLQMASSRVKIDKNIEKQQKKQTLDFQQLPEPTKALTQHFTKHKNDQDSETPTIAFVSKMIALDLTQEELAKVFEDLVIKNADELDAAKRIQAKQRALERSRAYREGTSQDTSTWQEPVASEVENEESSELVEEEATALQNEPKIKMVAFCRIFSGEIREGQRLYVLDHKHKPGQTPEKSITIGKNQIILLQGKDLRPLQSASTGVICGILGLDNDIYQSATLSTTPDCSSFSPPLSASAIPILQVVVEPENFSDWEKFKSGLKLLAQADPCCEVKIMKNGDHTIVASGEVHLERCIYDLTTRFTDGCKIKHSKPIAPFRETIVPPPMVDAMNESLAGQKTDFASRLKLTTTLLQLKDNEEITVDGKTGDVKFEYTLDEINSIELVVRAMPTDKKFLKSSNWTKFGKHLTNNYLLGKVADEAVNWPEDENKLKRTVLRAFNVGVESGPICAEPMQGVTFLLNKLKVNEGFSISAMADELFFNKVRKAFHRAFQCQPQRLLSACYTARVHVCTQEAEWALGSTYNVLSQRYGNILDTRLLDQTNHIIDAEIRVIESYGLVDALRAEATGGLAAVELEFTHWQLVDVDPYWMQTTQEEIEYFGTVDATAQKLNIARRYANEVRKRKGLKVFGEKTVEHAEKQRTLAKKK